MMALKRIRGLNERLLTRSGETLLELIGSAAQAKPQAWPEAAQRASLSPMPEALVDLLMAVVRLSAADNDLNPAVLASRKQLEQLALGAPDCAVMQGWRRALVGERLVKLLDGALTLGVEDGRVRLQ